MLSPKRVKYRKVQKGRIRGKAYGGCNLNMGDFGLQSLEHGKITARQIEAGRMCISKFIKKTGKLFIRIFPDKPISKKPLETRMGKGKGVPEFWVALVKPGRIIFELQGLDRESSLKALTGTKHKLPVKTKIVERGVTL